MQKHYLLLAPLAGLLLATAPHLALAQTTPTGAVGIGTTTPDASAALDVSSTTKGLLLPRLTQIQRDAIASPAVGLSVFNTTTGRLNTWNGATWLEVVTASLQSAATSLATFSTAGQYTYTVPAGVTSVRIAATGAAGGQPASVAGGLGGSVQATISVTPGEVLNVFVGGHGAGPPAYPGSGAGGGFNGGGSSGGQYGTGGGGATDLRRGGTALANRLLVAGGGGGAGPGLTAGGASAVGGNGGNPGANGGNDGSGTAGTFSTAGGGGGGTATAGGAGGLGNPGGFRGNWSGQAGSLGQGGNSGITTYGSGASEISTGGGGGGYYGGGGGGMANNGNRGGGGGGGSSWAGPGATEVVFASGVNAGDGTLTITLPGLPAPALDGSNFRNVPGDNLGNHTATQNLNLASYQLVGNGGSTGLSLDNSGNVGIGTTSPGQKLDVAGGIRLSGAGGLTFFDGTTQNTAVTQGNLTGDVTSTGLATTYAGVVPAAKGGAGTVSGLLKANGSGTVSPAVAGTDYLAPTGSAAGLTNFPTLNQNTTGNAATATLASTVTTNANLTGAITSTGNATSYSAVVPANRGGAGSINGLLKADGNGTVAAAVAGTDYLTPTAAGTGFIQNTTTQQANSNFNISGNGYVGGNVGIGTPIPSQKLDVRGNLRLGADGGSATGLGQTVEFVGPGLNTDPVGFYRVNTASDASELRVVVGDASDVNDRFSVGRTSASTEGGLAAGTFTPTFTVRADGNVGIGTTAPQAGLHVDRPESATSTALGVLLSGGSSGNPSIELRGNTSSPYIDFAENSNLDYSTRLISQAGTLNLLYGGTATKPATILNVQGGLQATAVSNTSDQRLKQHVRPLAGALASVLALRGVRYEWNALGVQHGGTAGAPQVGVLAQEVEKIYPELVSTDKDGYKAVNYAQLTPVLIEALKEQQAQIEALKAAAAAAKAESGAANTRAASADAKAAQATATLETFEARLRRLEAATSGQARR